MRDRMKWSTGAPPQDRAHVLTQPPGCSLLPPAARPPCGSQRRPAEPLPDPAVPLFCRVLVHLHPLLLLPPIPPSVRVFSNESTYLWSINLQKGTIHNGERHSLQ